MNNEWIKELKVGDNVFVCGRLGKKLYNVQRITPTGRIVVDGVQYDSNGRERTSDKWSFRMLEQATEANIKEYKQRQFTRYVVFALNNLLPKSINYTQAKEINEILNLGVVDTSEDKQ